ncbi:MAG: tRNA lysidine(34) synthetase TilS [Oscillospiraceae bacterium]|nr:tRNA lysidine(34) synthetase TilS [Oscillospiraceae bacterium]
MLNKLTAFIRCYEMIKPGDTVVCAVSGGADSMALLWAMYLLRDKLKIQLSAAHFNHHLRGEESDRDEAFVADFCKGYGIEFVTGSGNVAPGAKGLEAAAREARYAFLCSLSGKVATAHTASDNAETVLMHMVRGTGLRGLGGVTPVNGNVIRPMLSITREEVLTFLAEYSIPYVEDSSNAGDAFLRNRLRHFVMPLLEKENPSLAQNLSAMALRLRQDEEALAAIAREKHTNKVSELQTLEPGIRSRVLAKFLLDAGVKEPEAAHIAALESLLNSPKPSAKAEFPGGVTVARNYDVLEPSEKAEALQSLELRDSVTVGGFRISCAPNTEAEQTPQSFAVLTQGKIQIRPRREGDCIRLNAGTKSLKKLFIDKKIPAAMRNSIPVIADDAGVLGIAGIGANVDRLSAAPNAVRITIEKL